ncbi:MAG: DNA polymerase Y family protein [Rhodococcus sp.]|nr:DNA polymerase Y family protein [Rhodococcus sp. (in: high G+C Gram-positive bacteria)]
MLPVAVLDAGRVITCSSPARAEGVRRGLRRREAQARCPELYVAMADPDRDARLFEPVATAVDQVAPGVEILRPGLLVLSARGVSRYFGSEEAAAERLIDAVSAVGIEGQVGVADQLTTAVVAARRGLLVPPSESAKFLAPLPTAELAAEPSLAAPDRGDFVDLLRRLGIRTIGAYAALSPVDVASRFGADAVLMHRAARGEPERPPSSRPLPPDLDVDYECDPPLERVDAAAFIGRVLAEKLHQVLVNAGVACTRLLVAATTESGEVLHRTWRCAEPLTPESTADRVRWQLDGWLARRHHAQRVVRLRLEPVEVVVAGALQLGLWGGVGEEEERARRALVRVQGLLGGEAVQVGVVSGGRGPQERITLLPLGEERVPACDPADPWPGSLPAPSPAAVFTAEQPPSVRVVDGAGQPVTVGERGGLSAPPIRLGWGSREWDVIGWAGPWQVDERWWDPAAALEAARIQVVLEDSRALLLLFRDSTWRVEGIYE